MAPIKYCKQITGRSAGIFSNLADILSEAKVCLKFGDANKLMDGIYLFLSSTFLYMLDELNSGRAPESRVDIRGSGAKLKNAGTERKRRKEKQTGAHIMGK